MQNEELFISVVMPIRNESKFISETVHCVLEQDYSRFEILIVDGQSTDDTYSIIKKLEAEDHRVKVHSNPRKLSSAARNIGVHHANGDVILIVDVIFFIM